MRVKLDDNRVISNSNIVQQFFYRYRGDSLLKLRYTGIIFERIMLKWLNKYKTEISTNLFSVVIRNSRNTE